MTKQISSNYDKYILVILMLLLTLLPGLHKVVGDFPPSWFRSLFETSVIAKIPYGIEISFGVILFLEVGIGLLFLFALFKKEIITGQYTIMEIAFSLTMLLFLILFFGSFLIENYDNGFKDFLYLIGTFFIKGRVCQK